MHSSCRRRYCRQSSTGLMLCGVSELYGPVDTSFACLFWRNELVSTDTHTRYHSVLDMGCIITGWNACAVGYWVLGQWQTDTQRVCVLLTQRRVSACRSSGMKNSCDLVQVRPFHRAKGSMLVNKKRSRISSTITTIAKYRSGEMKVKPTKFPSPLYTSVGIRLCSF